jgi:DNA-binding NarL/FixJ family response regulator
MDSKNFRFHRSVTNLGAAKTWKGEFLNVDYPPAFNQIGKEQFDRAVARQMLLTDKQLEVARLVASGFDNGEVAAQLGITVEGVKKHVAAVMRKSKVDRRAKIVRWFVGL